MPPESSAQIRAFRQSLSRIATTYLKSLKAPNSGQKRASRRNGELICQYGRRKVADSQKLMMGDLPPERPPSTC